LFVLDKTTTGDAIIAALQVLTAVVQSGKRLHELRQGMTKFPQQLINVKVAQKSDPMQHADVASAVAQAEKELGREVVSYCAHQALSLDSSDG
jgi:phosphoglucosamine mutase